MPEVPKVDYEKIASFPFADDIIRAAGPDRAVAALGADKVVQSIGADKAIDAALACLTPEEAERLLRGKLAARQTEGQP